MSKACNRKDRKGTAKNAKKSFRSRDVMAVENTRSLDYPANFVRRFARDDRDVEVEETGDLVIW
jgi:hypothetical protein